MVKKLDTRKGYIMIKDGAYFRLVNHKLGIATTGFRDSKNLNKYRDDFLGTDEALELCKDRYQQLFGDGRLDKEFRILSVDAWADGEGGWQWNQWFDTGKRAPYESAYWTNRKLLEFMRKIELTSKESVGLIEVFDDGYNVQFIAKKTKQPLFAIEYGPWI